MRYLGLDLGTKTCGLAITDKNEIIVSPYKVIRYSNIDDLIKEIKKIIEEDQIDELVLGLPKNMNNSLGFAAERSLNFETEFKKKCSKKLHLVDERLSTKEAEDFLIFTNNRRKERKTKIDSYAATIILDTYLKIKKGQNNG